MTIRCFQCNKELQKNFPEMRWNSWLKLMNYFDHELSEQEITQATWEDMTGSLMVFRPEFEYKESQ